jgi:thymidylate synthase ThyX
MDQGAYFEVKRHRMMMQTPQQLTTHLGFVTPLAIQEAGVLEVYNDAMEKAAATYVALEAINPALAAYVVPNAYNRRLLITSNLRSLFHFIRLRSAPNAHFAVRRVAQRIAEEITKELPELATYLGRNESETSMGIERAFFLNTGKRGKL